MAERKPLSLNERNNRLLKGLSQSRSSKPPPPRSEGNARKVKLEGRRRLCKLSTEALDENSEEGWLDSLPTGEEKDDGVEQIRDILNDLTARLECLSVEKTKVTDRDPGHKPQREPEPVEFGSANSSLSPGPISCDSNTEEDAGAAGPKGKKVEAVIGADSGRELVYFGDEEEECVVLGINRKSPGSVGEEDEEEEKCDGMGRTSGVEDAVPVDNLDGGYVKSSARGVDGDSITLPGTGSSKSLMYTLPANIAKILFPHQRDGLRWLWSLHCGGTGGILGDDMGLGKTMQISSFIAGLFHSHLINRALIVTPKTLLSHWAKELAVVGLAHKTKDYFGTCFKAREYELRHVLKEGGVLLTTYDIVRNNTKSIRGDLYFCGCQEDDNDDNHIIWDYVILDEGHFIKNPSTQRAKSLFEIPSSHRIIISGTPIQNNLKELWALFNFCCPEVLGDKQLFKETYEHKILRGNEKNASDRENHIGSTAAKNLRERIKPFFLRRLKSEVFIESDTTKGEGLSKKDEIIVWLRLTQCQRQLYEAFLSSELVNFSKITGSPLAALTVLKKICDHPLLLTKRAAEEILEGIDSMLNRDELNLVEEMVLNLANMTEPQDGEVDNSVSCKTSFLLTLLDNLVIEDHTVLIFSQTRKMLNLIQDAIISKGYGYLRIDGTTKASDREKIVKDFQSGKAPIFLLTSQVGGLGLTLTKADRVIVVDPAWNPSTDNQSVDRAYRIGQKKDVLVYRLMTCGTIEEKIYKKQVFKGGLFRIATEHKEQTRYFSQKDLQELFSLPKQGFDVSLTQQQLYEEHDSHHTVDDYLAKHIRFLERHGIAGVSHHSLLFSKAATSKFEPENDVQRRKENVILRSSPHMLSTGCNANREDYVFNPKDMKSSSTTVMTMVSKYDSKGKAEEIEEKIKRLSRTLTNEVA
uniref:DNA excision repair protein ERCC-6-like n=1 Tax=Anthurium amnicola TaxID=1678845 RepID=A0A1D1Y0H2_9ARAE